MTIMEIAGTAAVVGAIIAVLMLINKRRQQDAWTGVLEKKGCEEVGDDDRKCYTLYFRTDDGRTVKYDVGEPVYDQHREGERFVKKSGEAFPTLVR